MIDLTPVILIFVGLGMGGAGMWYATRRWSRWRAGPDGRSRFREDRVVTQTLAERVRSVGKLVALEVCAKEIATASSGWGWLPPLILSQARLAMIFHFEKQYTVDMARIAPEDVMDLGDSRFRIRMPQIEGALRLIDMTPYDIQSARVLGLLDLVPMTADRQRELMKRAQQQASALYESNNERYVVDARLSAERHLRAFTELLGVRVEFEWPETIKPTIEAIEPDPIVEVTPAKRRMAIPMALKGLAS